MCERFNRTIVERARCLLYDAKFKKFWAEAVHTAVYLKNRTVASGLNQTLPMNFGLAASQMSVIQGCLEAQLWLTSLNKKG